MTTRTMEARAVITAVDRVSPVLKALIPQLKRLQETMKAVKSASGSLQALRVNVSGMRAASADLERLTKAFRNVRSAANAMAGASGAMKRSSWIDAQIAGLRQLDQVQRQVIANQKALNRGGGGPMGGAPKMPAMPAGAGMPRFPAPGGAHVPGADQTRTWLREGFDAAASVPQIQALMRMRLAGEKDPAKIAQGEEQIKRATDLAAKMAQENRVFSTAEHLQAIYQAQAVFGDLERAMAEAPRLQKYNALIEGLKERYSSLNAYSGGTMTKDFARIFDILGATENPKFMDALGTAIIKGVVSSSGDITPSDYLGTLKYTRTAKYGYSPEFVQNYLPGIIGDAKFRTGGATSAGVGLASMYAQFHNLQASNQAKEEMVRLGLVDGEFERGAQGKIKGRGTAEIKSAALLRSNPYLWATQVLLPAIEAKEGKLTGDPEADAGKVQAVLGRITSNRVAADTIAAMILQRDERDRDARIASNMPGIEGLDVLKRDAPVTALQSLTAATQDFFATIAGPAVKPAVDGMNMLTGTIRSFLDWRNENPVAGTVAGTAATAGLGAAGLWGARKAFQVGRNWFFGGGGAAQGFVAGGGAAGASGTAAGSAGGVAAAASSGAGWLARMVRGAGVVGANVAVADMVLEEARRRDPSGRAFGLSESTQAQRHLERVNAAARKARDKADFSAFDPWNRGENARFAGLRPRLGAGPVEGGEQRVSLDPNSKVEAFIKVELSDGLRAVNMGAQSSGSVQGNVGVSMPHLRANGPR